MSDNLSGTNGASAQVSIGAELIAIEKISALLDDLSPAQRSRVLGYISSALEVEEVSFTEPSRGAAQDAPMQGPLQAGLQGDPRRVFAEKRPTSDLERVLVLAHMLAQAGAPFFDSKALEEQRLAAAVPPFNIVEAGKTASKKGYFTPAGTGKRQLTVLGEDVANALPDRNEVKKLLEEQTGMRSKKRTNRNLG